MKYIISLLFLIIGALSYTIYRNYCADLKYYKEAKKEAGIITGTLLVIDTTNSMLPIRDIPQGMDYEIVLIPANNYGVSPDSIQIWDEKRLVGTLPLIENTPIANLIYDDNQ